MSVTSVKPRLKDRIHEIKPLAQEREFVVWDITTEYQPQHTARFLAELELIRQVDTVEREMPWGKTKPVKKWQWKEEYRQFVLDYAEQIDTLPCGHKVHIWNPPRIDGLACKECMELGTRKTYTKEFIQDNYATI